MSTEIDLVHDYMSGRDLSSDELGVARSMLEDAITLEIALDRRSGLRSIAQSSRRRKFRLARWTVGVTVAGAAAVAAVLILQVVPTSKGTTPEAAAAEISRLADVVQPVPPLRSGEWYQYQAEGVLSATVSSGVSSPGATPTSQVQASIPVALGEWSNATGAICTSQQFGSATFPDATDAQAWSALGLIDTPTNQPATDCSAGAGASNGVGLSVAPIDVSSITHDPATFSAELRAGTTGIQSIDQYAVGELANQAAFERLAVLLVSPASGEWSGFGQEMLMTMALVPGVISLGTMTSHAGESGLAFTAQTDVTTNPMDGSTSTSSPPTVILDTQSGAVLEARNLNFPVLISAAQDFIGSPLASIYSQGAGYGATAQWFDPVAPVSVVEQDAVPNWVSTFHIIEAVTKLSTTQTKLTSLLANVNRVLSDPNVPAPGLETFDITIMGTAANAQGLVSALTASGLFSTISVKL
jgi:hypothetical protein